MKTMDDEDLRIVLVSGDIYRLYSFDVNKLNYEGPADKFQSLGSYARSKLYQVSSIDTVAKLESLLQYVN